MKNTIFVIDAYNLIYRMFYAVPEMHTREGIQVNAIFGVAKFLKALSLENPHATVIVANDVGPSFRSEVSPDYKGTRERMPDNLRSQISGVFEIFSAANIDVIGQNGYEADDIMGSIACQFPDEKNQVVIISSDKDLCQFVRDDSVHIYDAMKRKFMREKDVLEKFGVWAEKVRDYLAIVGDVSDNIPGISGIGPKKAKDILEKYHSLEWLYLHLADFTPKMQLLLKNGKEMAFLSQKLATIVTDLPITLEKSGNFREKILSNDYQKLLQKYEFRSLFEGNTSFPEKKIHMESCEIKTWNELDELLKKIKEKNTRMGIWISSDKIVYLSENDTVYSIDAKKVDARELGNDIVSGDMKIVAYDVKYILGMIYKIIYPEGFSPLQDSLF